MESGTEQLSSGCNYLEGKQTWRGQTTFSLSTTNCLKNPFSCGSLTKAHFPATSQSSELLCPLLQHTEPKLPHSRPRACTSGPSSHLSAGILTSYNTEAWPLWSWSLHQGSDQSRRQATVLQEKQEPIQYFFALSFILEGSQEINPHKQKATV